MDNMGITISKAIPRPEGFPGGIDARRGRGGGRLRNPPGVLPGFGQGGEQNLVADADPAGGELPDALADGLRMAC